jgi:hypothetical protein
MTHSIKHLGFGPYYPGQLNPLDGYVRTVKKKPYAFKYFLKVVPTEYYNRLGERGEGGSVCAAVKSSFRYSSQGHHLNALTELAGSPVPSRHPGPTTLVEQSQRSCYVKVGSTSRGAIPGVLSLLVASLRTGIWLSIPNAVSLSGPPGQAASPRRISTRSLSMPSPWSPATYPHWTCITTCRRSS